MIAMHDFLSINAFAIILVSEINGKKYQIIKFDGDQNEAVNVHYYFRRPVEKKYLAKPINWETVETCLNQIRNNWYMYLSQYKENYYI